MSRLEYALPHEVGVEANAVRAMLEAYAEKGLDIHGFVLLRHGKIFSEGWVAPYGPELRHMLFSLTKSFTSTAVGFAVQEGLLSVEDRVIGFFPERLPCEPCENMRTMRVKHLLNMCTGHAREPEIYLEHTDALTNFLRSYVEMEPGSEFLYNTAATGILAYILEKLTGMGLDNYLAPRLFEPLGIEDFLWDRLPDGVRTGGFGLNLRTGDIAKFGKFLLQKGMWEGKQLLNAAWIEEATTAHIIQPGDPTPDWKSGYGYQFWRCSRYNAVRGDGAFGQLCVLFPEQDMVVAVNAGLGDMQAELDVLYDFLLPGVHDGPIAADSAAQEALEKAIAGLSFPTPTGIDRPALAEQISGITYEIAQDGLAIHKLSMEFGREDFFTAELKEGGRLRYRIGKGEWALNGPHDPELVEKMDSPAYFLSAACAGAWVLEDTYRLEIIRNQTPFVETYLMRFDGPAMQLDWKQNVGFEGTAARAYGLQVTE